MTAPLVTEVVGSTDGFAALRDEWDDAVAASLDPNVFLTWEWLFTWWQHFGHGSPRARLHLVVVRDADGIVAAAPLFRLRQGVRPVASTTLRQVGYNAGDYGGVVVVRRADEAVDALLGHLAGLLRDGVDDIHLSRLASDTATLTHLRAGLARPPHDQALVATELVADDAVCPYTDVRDGYDLVKPLRKNRVPQRLRRLGEAHEVEFHDHSGPTLEQGIEWLTELHERRWADRADEFQGLLADRRGADFLADAIRAFDTAGWVRLLTLTADGRPIAVRLDFDYGRRLYMLKNAIDPDFNAFGPGHITHARAIEDGMARGIEEFDFLRGDHAYKRRWANGERHILTLRFVRPGLAGELARQRSRAAGRLDRRRPDPSATVAAGH